jgi:outer membrane protein assembly factor BamB
MILSILVFTGLFGSAQAEEARSLNTIPVLEWQRPLPGDKVGGLFHTERARPAVHEDLVYVGAAGGQALYALSLSGGGLAHTYPAEAAVFSSPVFAEGSLYFCDSAGYTYRYELGASAPTWTHFGGVPIGSTPTLHGAHLYVATVDDLVFAIDTSTGETVWRYQHPPDATRESELTLFGAPSPVVQGDEVLLGFSDGSLAGLSLAEGQVNWERQVGEGRYPDLIATPVIAGEDIFLGAFSEPFLALDRTTHSPRWSLKLGTAAEVSVHGDTLLLGGSDGKLRSIDRKSGEVLWAWDSATAGALTAPQITPAGVVVASSDGGIYLISLASGRLLWSYQPDYSLDGISAAPLVVGGRLIAVTNGGTLLSFRAVGKREPPESWRAWDLF